MDQRQNESLEICRSYLELASKVFSIKQAYLFGSYARGTPHPDSDIDLALVSSDFEEIDEMALMRILYRMARHVNVKIEPIPLLENEGEHTQLGTLSYEIAKEGIALL